MSKMLVYKGFIRELSKIQSLQTRRKVDQMLRLIEQMPGVGASLVSPVIRRRYGSSVVRALAGPYQINFEYDPETDVVKVYDLLYSPSIR